MESIFILYVKDQNASCNLYEKLFDKKPHLHVPGMTEFILNNNTKLGLMPEECIVKILKNKTKNPAAGNGIPRAEVYLYVNNLEEYYNRAKTCEMIEVSGIEERNWGDTVCYFADSDGHIIAFAKRE
ncbi:MAG: lactoylglutathione lyase [Bacteroidetes bacterium]|nr:lactoylglutathione lyase [Bacteroidota bacterium]NOG96162.1 lactoylglutathione lyase [Bacteroidota bacterium]GIK70610.1 MAG: hypothetical protein BroJett020_19050 [Bacteroidota bacterium]